MATIVRYSRPDFRDDLPGRECPDAGGVCDADSLLVDVGFWAVLGPLLPERPAQKEGRPTVSDRAMFAVTVFVLVTGVPWRMVRKRDRLLGPSAWRRLRNWQAAGLWEGCWAD
jgi:transposase